jgi:DUF2924 family protein
MGNISRGRSETQVALEVARLATLSVKELKARWRSLYATEPPRYISRELLTRAVGYRLQERAFGGLKPTTIRLLERLGGDRSANHLIHSAAAQGAATGSVLIREWRGVSHRVEILDDGVVYRGQRYQSLSEVARLITGSRWSGPLFFGLKNRAKEARNG